MDLGLKVNRLDYWNLPSEIPYDKYLDWMAWTMLDVERNDLDSADEAYVTPSQLQMACGQQVTVWNGRF